jgi:hypothetical protein
MHFRRRLIPSLAISAVIVASVLYSQEQPQEPDEQLEQGEYLTHHVAMCIVCHSPKNEEGQVIELRKFEGAPIPIKQPYGGRAWAFQAPRIAGLPGYRDEDIIHLLTTGRDSDGRAPRPPMPSYRLTRKDAEAVVAYLKSLP